MSVSTWNAPPNPFQKEGVPSAFDSPMRLALSDLGLDTRRRWTFGEVLLATRHARLSPRQRRALEALRVGLPL